MGTLSANTVRLEDLHGIISMRVTNLHVCKEKEGHVCVCVHMCRLQAKMLSVQNWALSTPAAMPRNTSCLLAGQVDVGIRQPVISHCKDRFEQ